MALLALISLALSLDPATLVLGGMLALLLLAIALKHYRLARAKFTSLLNRILRR